MHALIYSEMFHESVEGFKWSLQKALIGCTSMIDLLTLRWQVQLINTSQHKNVYNLVSSANNKLKSLFGSS